MELEAAKEAAMQEKHELVLKLQAKVGVMMFLMIKIKKDGNNDVFDDEDKLVLTMQAKVGVEAALVGELEAMREAVRVKEEEERLNEERETEKYV